MHFEKNMMLHFPCEVGEEYLVAELLVEVEACVVEGVDDKVHAVGDEGHDDAKDAQEEPVLDLSQGLAPHQRQELGCAPVALEGWSKWILHFIRC